MSFSWARSLWLQPGLLFLLTPDNRRATPLQIQQVCAWTHALVGQLAPRTMEPDGETSPALIFTDAAYENGLATCGIVVIDSTPGTRTAMGGNIPKMLVDVWHDLGSQRVITLAEAFTAPLA